MFVKRYNDGNFLILLLYVDDMLIVGDRVYKIIDSYTLYEGLIKPIRWS